MLAQLSKVTDGDFPEEFDKLSASQQETLLAWIAINLKPIRSVNRRCTSYGLKHFFEASRDGFYITNGMFKGAMLQAGFFTSDEAQKNWHFNVSARSVRQLYEWINTKKD